MKVSREQVAENRKKILDVAGKLFREKGFEAVSVADIMAGAGLTHGGFYGYFKSKDDLIAETLAGHDSNFAGADLEALIAAYLSCAHKDNPGAGCAVAALGADIARMTPELRAVMTERMQKAIALLEAKVTGETAEIRRQRAIGIYAALIGGLTLARLCTDEALAAEILSSTRRFAAGE
jgi:Transcriptional regulator